MSGLADDEATQPEAPEPEAPEPDATEPEVAEPDAAEPEAPEPDAAEPGVSAPEAAEPEVSGPEPGAAAPPPPPPPPREPSLQDIAAQIDAIPIGPFLLSFVSTLLSRAYGKLGAGDLDEARGAIDAIRALMPVIEGRVEPEIKRDFDQALANLQVAYADASTKGPS